MLGQKQAPVTIVTQDRGSRFGRAMAIALVIGALAVVAGRLGLGFLPSVGNPFSSQTVDRSQPALLKSLEDLSRFQAATANLQVIVDSEKDTRFVPSFISGERTVFVASGSVDATVDFSALDARSIVVSPDRSAVTVHLPAPVLSAPRVDPAQSRVVSRDRGVLDRLRPAATRGRRWSSPGLPLCAPGAGGGRRWPVPPRRPGRP